MIEMIAIPVGLCASGLFIIFFLYYGLWLIIKNIFKLHEPSSNDLDEALFGKYGM